MNRCRASLLAAGLCLGVAGAAHATLVFEQVPTYDVAIFSDAGGAGWPNQRVTEDFVLSYYTAIDTVGCWGVYYPNNVQVDSFTINFYADAGNAVGALLYSAAPSSTVSVDTGIVSYGEHVYETTMTLATPFNAAGGVRYWIGLTNNTGAGGDWGWMAADADGIMAYSVDFGSTWITSSEDVSLRLYGVPAPSGLALVGIGGVFTVRRRR